MSFWSWIIKKMEKWPRWVVFGWLSVSVFAFTIIAFALTGTLVSLATGPGTADASGAMTPGAKRDRIDAKQMKAERLAAESLLIAPRDVKGSGFGVVKRIETEGDIVVVTISPDGFHGEDSEAFEAIDLKRDLKKNDRCYFSWFDGRRRSIGGVRYAMKREIDGYP